MQCMKYIYLLCFPPPPPLLRYIRSERSIILINFCLSIICSNILILVGQTQTHNAVSVSIHPTSLGDVC